MLPTNLRRAGLARLPFAPLKQPSKLGSARDRVLCAAIVLLSSALATAHAQESRVLDDFSDPSRWRVVTSNQVSGSLRQVEGIGGAALCLDYDYNGVSGYVGLQRDLPLDYPENYRFDFRLRGDSPRNDLQFKVVDAKGDNVWWVNKPKYEFPREWTGVRYKKRHIDKAWGPDPDGVLRKSAKLEFTVYNNAGGKGSVCFDELTFTTLPPEDRSPLVATAAASLANGSGVAANTVDGDPASAWHADFAAATQPALTLDLGKLREFGGLKLVWKQGEFASDYLVQTSDDGTRWRDVRTVVGGTGGIDYLALPESEARYLRLSIAGGPGKTFGLAEASVQPLEFAATPNDFIKSIAGQSPRGMFPRGFIGEQPYWTLVGIDGGRDQGLIGEDGAIELARGGPSVEPFVQVDGKLSSWADATISQSLQEGYLPIPTVEWKLPDFGLQVTAFAQGVPGDSQLVGRYRLTNTTATTRDYVLALAMLPFQVNPPTQFLSTVGGVSAIESLSISDGRVSLNGKARLQAVQAPASVLATTFDGGMVGQHLAEGTFSIDGKAPREASAIDSAGLASGALLYTARLAAGESIELAWV
ncbi:MAG: discoidin domain-containing protein, partial [Burkholderiales bacterium]